MTRELEWWPAPRVRGFGGLFPASTRRGLVRRVIVRQPRDGGHWRAAPQVGGLAQAVAAVSRETAPGLRSQPARITRSEPRRGKLRDVSPNAH